MIDGNEVSCPWHKWKFDIISGISPENINCRVKKITTNQNGKVNGVIYLDSKKKEKFQEARLIILACNGIGTPRLLLNSANNLFP